MHSIHNVKRINSRSIEIRGYGGILGGILREIENQAISWLLSGLIDIIVPEDNGVVASKFSMSSSIVNNINGVIYLVVLW